MNQRIYGRAIVAGAAGIAVKDLILQGAVALGWSHQGVRFAVKDADGSR